MGALGFDLLSERGLATTVAGFCAVFYLLYRAGAKKIHPDEPTVVPPTIPIVGHLLGMAFHGGKYVKTIGLAHKDVPIFTLPVPMSRLYIVTDPSLAAVVQRASKALSFTPLVPDITKRVLGLDKRTVEIVSRNLDPLPGEDRGFLADIHDMLYAYLGPGESLNEMSCQATQELYQQVGLYVELLRARQEPSEVVDLLAWVRHVVAIGTAMFLYGPENPFEADPTLESSFWDFDHGLGGLLMGIFPSLTAAKPYNGRERLARALKKYLEDGGHKKASQIVQNRVRIAEQYDWTPDMTARSELSFLFAGIVNTATTTFWVLLQIFARPALVTKIRAELEEAKRESESLSGKGALSTSVVKERCTSLVAVFQECLRVGSENFSSRLVKTDTMLADKYFLRKDSVVQIAGSVIHADGDIWGDNVVDFDHERFLKRREGKPNVHPAAFRAFGGGKTLCPGRHFATTEVIMLAALMITSFDFTATDGGPIEVPKKNDAIMPVHILEPLTEEPVKLRVTLKTDAEEAVKWRVVL
ncbi:uncharacterized protein DNG_05362 [Cephalotrichum gorgonifer]|uniref:P450 domain-containing protein n=1 Tax=Cephalotrichum gorgonifer TaxID=2041049 RepID=A0AAE8MZJ2_9PEZI|nr:uncharacterized protein DNG_05362 [Cephalotrichum gorgonifer]